jgi:hypothetical protein
MPANIRFIVIAISVLAAVTVAYFYLKTPKVLTSDDVPELLQKMPTANAADPATTPPAWPEQRALGRYDNLARAGNLIQGRWANNIKDACIAAVPITSIPDEKNWQQPINLMQCFDGATVLVIQLRD